MLRNAGWNFSGTIRNAVRPPQITDQKLDIPLNQATQKTTLAAGIDGQDSFLEENQVFYREDEDISPVGTGTVVMREVRVLCMLKSVVDTSTSGTIVYRGDTDSPQNPKSRLGSQELASTASPEDSAVNLAKAKATLQEGLRKGNVRDRSGLDKGNKDVQESRRLDKSENSSDSSRDFQDAIKAFAELRETSDDEDDRLRMSATSASATLSTLLIPSLKEEISDDLGAPVVNLVINALMDMEYTKPGSCEFLVTRLLHRLASSKEPSLKNLQDVATRGFSKGKKVHEQPENVNPETDNKKKQQNKESQSNANLSPLARFLLSRWQGLTSKNVNTA